MLNSLTTSGSFLREQEILVRIKIADMASIAIYEVLKLGRMYNLSVKLQRELTDKMFFAYFIVLLQNMGLSKLMITKL